MIQQRKLHFNYSILTAAYTLILIASVIPLPQTEPAPFEINDKWIHFIMYTFLSTIGAIFLLINNAQSYHIKKWIETISIKPLKVNLFITVVWLIPTIWGILMECVQELTPNRQFSLLDIVANTIGTTLAALIIANILNLIKKRPA